MRLVALVLIAVLALSFVPFLAGQQAQALSAISFTTLETVSSKNTQFQQVYENSTNSVVMLDTNSSGFYFKDAYEISSDTLDTDSAQLTGSGNTVDSHAYISPVDLSRYSLLFNGVDERAAAANSGVFDVTIGDFSIILFFERNSDSGAGEILFAKQQASARGYKMQINSNDQLVATIDDDSVAEKSATITTTTVGTGKDYAAGASWDRDGNLLLMLYDINAATIYTATTNIATSSGSITNTGTFTVARQAHAVAQFCPCTVDNLNVFLGTAISQVQFTEFATTGTIDGLTPTSWYDFNNGVGTTATDMEASNTLTLFNTPTWSSDVLAISSSRPSIYVTGRDNSTGVNGYGKWNLADLSEVSDNYQASDLAPLNIAQSTSNLYSTALNATSYGTLFDVSITRAFGSYIETSILTGDSTTPAMGLHMDVTAGTADREMSAAGGTVPTAVAEAALTSSVLIGGTFNAMTLRLLKEGSPPGTFSVGVLDSSNNFVFTCATETANTFLTTSAADYTFFCGESYTIALNDRIGIKYAAGDASNSVHIIYSSTQQFDGTASVGQENTGSWGSGLTGGTAADIRMKIANIQAKVAVYDGSPDTRYHFFESGTDTIRAIKRTGSTTSIVTTMSHETGSPFSTVQLSNGIIIQTATDTYFLDTSDDSVELLHGNSFPTRYAQTFEIAPAARTFNTAQIMISNSTYAILYNPNTGASARTGVFIDTVNTGGSGTIEGYDPSKWYYLPENDLTAEATSASDTSWEIFDVGSNEQVQITGYTEALGIDLIENTTAILAEDVIKLVCDNGDYLIEIQYFAVGSDADCDTWKTLDVISASTGRMLPYAVSGEVVHTSEYTDYTVQLSVANPSIYTLTTIYDGQDVDTGAFDSGGNTEQHYLLGQCYTLQIVEESTGNTLQTGVICAGQISPITISLSGIVIPDDWLRSTWSYTISRNYTDPDNNGVLFTFQKSVSPYNGSLYVTDNFNTAEATLSQWYNFTEVSGASIANVTGVTSNMTLYFTLYENDVPVINAVSNAEVEIDNPFSPANFGLLFGVPLTFIFPILTAAMFPKSLAYFGAIVTVAVIGIMSVFGYITLPVWFWAIIMPVLAFAVFVGARR